ncbi:hypothetical protein N0V86_004044 [Didymella sp. IMI 355093]|nr:hypothetical protein N0V86_004044 [Didymella sp. IMI 355093]
MASPYDAPLPFYNRAVMSNETFVDQYDQVKTARDQIKTAHPAALAQSNAEALAEVLRMETPSTHMLERSDHGPGLICWIRSTEYLIPLDQFDVCASINPYDSPTGCPNTADEPTARLSATELHTIKILYYVDVTNKWVIVKESACSHPDPWQTMKCLVFELRKEFQQRAGWGAELAQGPITSRHKKATRRPRVGKGKCKS